MDTIWIINKNTNKIHKYGTEKQDNLTITEYGTLKYVSLSDDDSLYDFCDENGNILKTELEAAVVFEDECNIEHISEKPAEIFDKYGLRKKIEKIQQDPLLKKKLLDKIKEKKEQEKISFFE